MTTTNLADFGFIELKRLELTLMAWRLHGLPDGFYAEEVVPMFNPNSGHVFLCNSDSQSAMLCDGKLELWNYCGNCGHERFSPECTLIGDGCNECEGHDD